MAEDATVIQSGPSFRHFSLSPPNKQIGAWLPQYHYKLDGRFDYFLGPRVEKNLVVPRVSLGRRPRELLIHYNYTIAPVYWTPTGGDNFPLDDVHCKGIRR